MLSVPSGWFREGGRGMPPTWATGHIQVAGQALAAWTLVDVRSIRLPALRDGHENDRGRAGTLSFSAFSKMLSGQCAYPLAW